MTEDPLFPELFTRQADRTPDAVAVVSGRARLTYRQLEERSARLAGALVGLGAGPERVIAVALPRSVDLLVSLIAVLRSGSAYLPVDLAYPVSRIEFLFADAAPALVVTEPGTELPANAPRRVSPEDSATRPALAAVRPHDPAYVIYTSGSTGRPKGVVVEHTSLGAYLRRARDAYPDAAGTSLVHTPAAFDLTVTALYTPLVAGGTVRLSELDEPGPVPTFVKGTPSHLTLLDGLPPQASPTGTLILGGEALHADMLRVWRVAHPDVLVVNAYGPTEATVNCLEFRIPPGTVLPPGPVPIGRPFPYVRAHVLDDRLVPVAEGRTGELFVAGDALARGYLNQPGLTATRFVADPYGPAGSRMYRTGDLVRVRADGDLEYVGRADHQVKVRGFRVEPGEIEAVLTEHDAVARAVVVAAGERLVAYVVPEGETPTVRTLRAHLAARLPAHMVPSVFVPLREIPLTANGKLDRAALPAPAAHPGPDGRSPESPAEELLCDVFAEVLGVRPVWTDSDFFALGGHSLLAARLDGRLHARTGVRLGLRAVFDAPTPAALAVRLAATSAEPAMPSIPARPAGVPIPLSPGQARLWFTEGLTPDTAEYVIPVALRISGNLDPVVLGTALRRLTERHEALRVRVVVRGDQPEQVVDPPPSDLLPVTELDSEDALTAFVVANAVRAMDLAEGPLFRAALGRRAADDHVLVLCVHHIVADDWSLAVLADDLAALYDGTLPAPVVRYSDVVAWQHGRTADARHLDHWRSRLAGMPHVLELPTDRPRARERDPRGARLTFDLPPALTTRLRTLAGESGATLFMALLSGFQALLARYTGARDFAVGTPVAGRDHPDTEDTVGFFANLVVLRADLTGDPTFRDLVDRARDMALFSYEHQDTLFDQVVEAVRPPRDLGRNPLVQVVFALQTAATASWRLPGLCVSRTDAHTRTSKFDLFVALHERGDGGLTGIAEYPVALFDTATIERLVAHYTALLTAFADAPDRRVFTAPLLSPRETAWLRRAETGPVVDLGDLTIDTLVTRQVAARPDAVAVVAGTESLTRAELDHAANRLAHHLLAVGVGRETPVAVCLPRGPDVPVVLLGILRAGGCYVPLDADYPRERLAHMLADTGASVVIAASELAPRLPGPVLVWEDLRDAVAGLPTSPPPVATAPDHIAYVIYTSGSTGTPKGVQVSHRAVVRLVHGANFADLGPDTTVALLAPLSFDASTLELWGALCTGARLAVFPPGVPSASALADFVRSAGVTLMWLTAGLFHAIVDTDPSALTGVRHLLTGGDVVSRAHVARLRATGDVVVGNGYGPTESTTFACVHRDIAAGDAAADAPVPIGVPVTNTTVHVLDEYLNRVPVGVPGDLLVGGPGLARGYLGNPGLTAQRFTANPFEPGTRLYRTGDRVRWLPSGDLEFLGRADRQLKVRGFRVEPGEIEARLLEHPSVTRALVVANTDAGGDKRLVAYVAGSADRTRLRDHCGRGLPSHLVPAAFVVLPELPLDPNGKVDRTALPDPDWTGGAAARREPETPVERAIAEVWARTLDVPVPGLDDDFFALGGHSLAATRIVTRLRSRLGVVLGVHSLFRSPTVATLAAEVAEALPNDVEPIPRHTGPVPLAPVQSGLWLAGFLDPGGAEYLVTRALRLRGTLDVPALASALATVVARHEPLRTRYPMREDEPVGWIDPPGPVPLPVEDVTDVDAFLETCAAAPLDLADGTVFRAALGRLAPDDHVLVLLAHHIAIDGWSIGVLADELSAAYAAHRDGRPPDLPPLPIRYADYAAWAVGRDTGVEHWAATLKGMPPVVDLAADRPRPRDRDTSGALVPFTVPAPLAARVAALASARRTTPFVVLVAAFTVLVRERTGLHDFGIGTPMAGRRHPDTERLVGHFVNTVVLRADLAGRPAFTTLVDRLRDTTLTAIDHQDVPFDRVVRALGPPRELSRNPLAQLVVVVGAGAEGWRFAGLSTELLPRHTRTSKFDLTVALHDRADGSLAGSVEYATALFGEDTVRALAARYTALVEDLVGAPEEPVW
ncbi:hypothetical protein BLA60_04400 [Actinophytocola xinjiangensis]|uniref:Carrier domain-containing protein n=1 Tax=Actinophytocola xinjiangensis TaxID=485602 RepID=A0A7Z0WTP6_9PSEU|nr:non-ribosomal peptide synthetase [Actinophytocola xinjiangensis]OLF14374.1 hypothetical protein BLA60_04400 [Actinophytocola xinjiangensis]